MRSLRENLPKIGIPPGTSVSYRNSFASRPNSLSQAMRSMDAPANWLQVGDIFVDAYWTDEVQGVAWDGHHWIFSCNANQSKPGANDKAIYVFNSGQPLKDGNWMCRIAYKDVPHPIAGTQENDDHWGQVTYHNGFVYVSHFWESGPWKDRSNVVVFKDNGGYLAYHNWIKLGKVTPSDGGDPFYPEFQAINPWDGYLYACRGGPNTREFYAHDPETGDWKDRKTLKFSGGEQKAIVTSDSVVVDPLSPNQGTPFGGVHIVHNPVAVDLPSEVQGACFSPNGHLYIACDVRLASNQQYKAIVYFSALNGHLMGIIPVLAEEENQELEGICFGNVVSTNGNPAQIHAILLENRDLALDNIFFKSYSADRPEVV